MNNDYPASKNMHPASEEMHLASEEMEALLSEPETRGSSQHLRVCGACSAEFESLLVAMGDLRAAAITAAERHRRLAVMPAPAHRTPRVLWSLVAAAALICIAGPLALHQRPARIAGVRAPQPQAQGAVSDEQLLSEIQEDLSSPVPQSMFPLAASAASTEKAGSTYSLTYSATSSAKENE